MLSTNTYEDYANATGGGNLTKTVFANEQYVTYTYDELDRVVKKQYNSGRYITYAYSAEGQISRIGYGDGGTAKGSYDFEYDSLGRLIRSVEYDGSGTVKQRTEHLYDACNRLSSQKWSANGKTYTERFTYDDSKDGSMKKFRAITGHLLKFTYDGLRRLQKTSVTASDGTPYYTAARSFYASGNKATNRVEYFNYRMADGTLIAGDRYVYDALGNITQIQESEIVSGGTARRTRAKYTYDSQNQLKTETYYTYSGTSTTPATTTVYEYTYDTAGNIQTVSENGTVTQTYTYGDGNWADKLTKLNGQTITYDASGNPTSWNNGKSYTGLTWVNGRQLSSITTGGKTTTYAYDADGIRMTKVVNGTTHEYLTQNGKVVWEKIGTGDTAKIMVFAYDAEGRPFAVKYSKDNGAKYTNYFYALNQQGDVVKIFRPVSVKDDDGNVTGYTEKVYATYAYDAWGNLTAITNSNGTDILSKQTTNTSLANLNPLRYRGYYYDNETGFYYLQSRYYDPANHRFLNADVYASTDATDAISCNMFAYCKNNPVTLVDESGEIAGSIVIGITVEQILEVLFGIGVSCLTIDLFTDVFTRKTPFVISLEREKAEQSVAIAEAGTEIKIYSYWEAEKVGNSVVVGNGLTLKEAALRVATGQNIMCRDEGAARTILLVNGYAHPVGPEKHGANYYYHYHPNRNNHTHLVLYNYQHRPQKRRTL